MDSNNNISDLIQNTLGEALLEIIQTGDKELIVLGQKIDKYNRQVIEGSITIDNYQSLLKGIKENAELLALQAESNIKIAVQKLVFGIIDLIK